MDERPWEFEPRLSHPGCSLLRQLRGSDASRGAVDAEPLGPRCDGEFPVMRRDRQGIELVPHKQGAGQMDRIERTDNRRERISRPLENRCPERHQGEAFDRLQGCGTPVGYLGIVKAET